MADEVQVSAPVIPIEVPVEAPVVPEDPTLSPIGVPSESVESPVTTELVVVDGEEFVKVSVGNSVTLIRL